MLLAITHEHAERGRGSKHFAYTVALDNLPGDGRIGIIDSSFAEQRSYAGAQRRINNVGVTDNPANVRSAPEDVARTHIEKCRQMVGRADHISAMDVDDTLRLAGSARRVEDEQGIFGIHLLGGTVGRKF